MKQAKKLQDEILQLKYALKQRSIELEQKNRELEIEAAIERVRAQALAMHESKDIHEVVRTLRNELFGLKLEGIMGATICLKQTDGQVRLWDITDIKTTGRYGWDILFDIREMDPKLWVKKIWYSKKKIIAAEQDSNDLKRALKWLSQYDKKTAEEIIKLLKVNKIKHGWHRAVKLANGILITDFTNEPPAEIESILLKMGAAFDLAYKRFLDLKNAEVKAHEAKIEASLERMRAAAMSMHKSEDLIAVCKAMYNELQALGFTNIRNAQIAVNNDAEEFYFDYEYSDFGFRGVTPVPYNSHPIVRGIVSEMKKSKDAFFHIEITGHELNEFRAFRKKKLGQKPDVKLNRAKSVCFYFYSVGAGALGISTFNAITEEQSAILKGFKNVFELSYRRYTDVAKAEAQAREAQIEASLERVRAVAMAMHNSEDLSAIGKTVFTELKNLGFTTIRNTEMVINNDEKETVKSYHYSDYGKEEIIEIGYKENPIVKKWANDLKKADDAFVPVSIPEKEMKDWNKYRKVLGYKTDLKMARAKTVHYYSYSIGLGALSISTWQTLEKGHIKILERFRNVFNLSYKRYIDIQKAEAQAREAQIEAALERVRSKAMAMHKSDDLNSAVGIVFEELEKLDLGMSRCGIGIVDKEKRSADVFSTVISDLGQAVQVSGDESMDIHPLLQGAFDAWLKQVDFSYTLQGEDLVRYYKAVGKTNIQLPQSQTVVQQQYYYVASFQAGGLFAFRQTTFPEEAKTVMKRFANVFNLTYKRFLDLQKAEAQAREAQIEAALERVRSRTMAMQKSDELNDVAIILFKQASDLGIKAWTTGFNVWSDDDNFYTDYITNPQGGFLEPYTINATSYSVFKNVSAAKKKGEEFYVNYEEGEQLKETYRQLSRFGDREQFEKMLQGGFRFPSHQYEHFVFGSKVSLMFITYEPCPEAHDIFKRFAKVFEQTYTRFLDLQKAEAQAREAQIEAGLERVRARTMAMHSSEDVSEATATMFTELEKLGIENYRGGITNIFPNRTQHVWSVNNLAEGKSIKAVGTFNIDDHPFWQLMFHDWESKQDFTWYFLAGDDKEKYIKILNATQGYLPQAFQQFPDVHFHGYYFNEGAVWTNSLHKHSEDEQQIMKRFASVFSLTFRRYQDLKKAEAQAREAKIEAAMEKVRARAMAMQKPGELEEVAKLLRREMALLGVEELETSSIYVHNENAGTTDCWYAIKDIRGNDTNLVTDHMTINLNDTWVGKEMLKFYNSAQNQTSILMKGENRKEWINYCSQHSKMLQGYYGDTIPERTYHLVKFSNGYMGAASPGDISKESWDLLKRATSVFSLAYTRFSDLQKSEANAKEAVKQAALDRIRADIASMRTKTDLDRITPLIWKELTILGLPFIRCGVFIMDDSQQLIHTFLSTPEGHAIAAFHLPYNTPGNFSDVIEHWRSKKVYINHWNEADFLSLAETLVNQGAIANKEQYLNTLPEGGFYLHLLPFMQGMFYVGNSTRLNEEEIKLIQSVADAFSTAYARYEDFNKLEAAKQQVERTLTDLKQAQQQLVQSEKMASLGELTAGIAHEIQNPLNFVNNFSEVSNELIEEMKAEFERGNKDEAIALAEDVKQNLEKILFHGKRADGIVKGMLQHSRSSSGVKELVDINILADEYLRLAYHGLRAKDKSFNAKFETNLDTSIEKINVVPQEIGRVILNLINNAFYAVSEKKKSPHPLKGGMEDSSFNYEPVVTVTTKRLGSPLGDGGKIEIKVSDNGKGIPQKILDKIFQPFFTTKPTGQGTGLGLSLSYDIVKAHGGEIKVVTKDGEGTEFTISLPVS